MPVRTTRRRPFSRAFYARDTALVARELLGARLISTVAGVRVEGRIVETEAYLGPHDPASHAAERIGRTRRNAAMYGPPGTAYVYRIYGLHWCLNVVTEAEGFPAAVLVRAVLPLRGLPRMRAHRWPARAPASDRQLASGPGKLAAAFAITGALDGHDLRTTPLIIVRDQTVHGDSIVSGPRIGVTRALDWPLRFHLRDCPWISQR